MDEMEIRSRLMKKKGWPQAISMIALLEGSQPGVPIDKESLARSAKCEETKVDGYLSLVRAYLESQKKKLCNLRGVGWWISVGEGDKLREAVKEASRMLSHASRLSKTMDEVVDSAQITSPDEAAVYGTCVALGSTAKLLSGQYRELTNRLITTTDAQLKLRLTEAEVKAPLRDLIGVEESPEQSLREAMREDDKDEE